MKKVGLAFEGGALRGSYQIGAYYAFKNNHIKINGIVGTSIGAFNAAVIVSGNADKLFDFWKNIEPGKILDINDEVVKYFNGEKLSLRFLKGLNKTIFKILANHGIKTDKMYKVGEKLISYEKMMKSKMDYGLVTIRLKKLHPIYKYKEEISPNKLIDSIIASCYLPIFRLEPIIDDNIYIDGGFYDNCPTYMLAQKNYDVVYEIRINGIGFNRHLEYPHTKVITISPSRNICSVLEMNSKKLSENILLGYYDTLRVIKHYDGKKYVFKKTPDFLIKRLASNLSRSELKRLKNFFKTKTTKQAIILAVEYILENENINYYKIYNLYYTIRIIQKKYVKNNNHFIYQLVNKLRIFRR